MLKYIIFFILYSLTFEPAIAANEGKNQANSFMRAYSSLCLKHLHRFEILRGKLAPLPKFPPKQAAFFLSDHEGDAWPLPEKYGTLVLALPTDKSICLLHMRRSDTEEVIKHFTRLVESAPPPLVSKKVREYQKTTTTNGITNTIVYEWSIPDTPRKMSFTLTTASSPTANIQVLGSAAIVNYEK